MDEESIKKCKCCLEEDGLLNLWDEYQSYGDGVVYGVMIKECFSIPLKKPSKNEQEYICEGCIIRLMEAVNFKKEILSSDTYLKGLNNESNMKQEDSDIEIKTEYLDLEFVLDDDCKDISDAVFSDNEENVEIEEPENMDDVPNMQRELNSCIKEIQDNDMAIDDAASMYGIPLKVVTKELKKISKQKRRRKRQGPILSDPIAMYTSEQLLLNHIRDFSNATPLKGFNGRAYECYFCSNQYENPADLKSHNRTEHRKTKLRVSEVYNTGVKMDITDLTCLICQSDVNLITDLCNHLKTEHNKKFIENKVINFLIPIKFNGDELKCVICGENFLYFKLLFEHMKKHFKNYECEQCGYGFITRRTLKAHIRRHGDGEYKCSYCPKIFFTKCRVTEHQKQVHLKIKRNKCSYCDEKFVDLMKKKDHEYEVHGGKKQEYACQACDRTFKSQKSRACHIKEYHLMIRRHSCTMCDQSFITPLALKDHMVKHTKARDYICNVCNKGFGRRYTLVEHMRIHLNDRRHKCDICGSAFIQKCSLKSHMASKHPRQSDED